MIAKILFFCISIAVAHGVAVSVVDGRLALGNGLFGHGIISGTTLIGGHGIAYAKAPTVDLHTPAHYEFKYGVHDSHTGDNKQQSEVRVGDSVKGEYSLAEPDGTIRIVKYTADPHNGFNAVVSKVGHAVHPQILHKAVVAPVVSHGLITNHGIVTSHDYGFDLGLH